MSGKQRHKSCCRQDAFCLLVKSDVLQRRWMWQHILRHFGIRLDRQLVVLTLHNCNEGVLAWHHANKHETPRPTFHTETCYTHMLSPWISQVTSCSCKPSQTYFTVYTSVDPSYECTISTSRPH